MRTGDHDALLGETIADCYRIEAFVARGGMSVVYRASDARTGGCCAVKVLPPHYEGPDKALSELRAVLAVSSPHIVDVIDFGRLTNGSSYLVMEYVVGTSLAEVIRREGSIRPERALHVGMQLARTLATAHEAGVIHRDLKPDNVLLTQRDGDPDFVRLLDFGLAQQVGETGASPGTLEGTPGYMSPEQIEGREVDVRTDIYSLGVVLYEMLAGTGPFAASTAVGLLTQHVCKTPRPPSERARPDTVIPRAVDAVVLRCLAKRPGDRYRSMRELLAALDDVATEPNAAEGGATSPRLSQSGAPGALAWFLSKLTA